MGRERPAQAQAGLKRAGSRLASRGPGEERHRARVLMVAGLVFVVAGSLISVVQVVLWIHPGFPPAPGFDLAVDAVIISVGGLTLWLVQSRRIRPAAWLMLGFLLTVAVVHLCTEGQPTTDISGGLGLFLVVVLAFVLLDHRSAWIVGVISAVSFIGTHIAWLGGHLPQPTRRDPSGQVLFSIFTWLTTAGIVAAVVSATMQTLRKHHERLEEMVKARTQELQKAQQRLLRQERLALLGKLAGGVGHELRNPLGAIKNAAYFLNMVLAEEQVDPEVKEALEILEQEVAQSERIISGLLDYARTRPPTQEKVDLNSTTQAALSRTEVPQSVEVRSQLDHSLPAVRGDRDQLGQVLENLIRNAVQAMREGGRLTVRTEMESPEWVVVSVTDTGVGIPRENLERIFEPLFTTRAKGIGLGLAVARTLVEGHGGTIEVESEAGGGSAFRVRLPIGGKKGEACG